MRTDAVEIFIRQYDNSYYGCDNSFVLIIHADKDYRFEDLASDFLHLESYEKLLFISGEDYTDEMVFIDTDTITSIEYYAQKCKPF